MKKYKSHIIVFLIIFFAVVVPRLAFAFCILGCDGWDPDSLSEFGLPHPDSGISGILEKLLAWLFLIIGIISVMAFVIAGIMYITSAGDEDQAKQAKRAVTNSVIGIVVALIGWAVITLVFNLISGTGEN